MAAERAAGDTESPLRLALITPVNVQCASCHHELFSRPPRGHPPEQSYCASCHAGHSSRQKSLLLDDDVTHACLDYPPPYPEKPAAPPRRKAAAIAVTK